MATRTMSEMKQHVAARAGEDEDFRTRLIADPKSVIEAELGVSIPEQFVIHVHEDDATAAHLTLPPSERLTGEDLAHVAGGNWGQDSMDQLDDDMNNL